MPLERLTTSFSDFARLVKIKLISAELLLAVSSLLLAGGWSVSWISLAELVMLGYMGLGGSAAINSYIDRDVDAVMSRTVDRPIPAGRISPGSALAFGIALLFISVAFSAVLLGVLTAAIIGVGSALYILFYTVFLKRRTPNAVIWGGISGAIPALGGWSVYTHADWAVPFLVFLVVFLWQPGHFWSLSIYYRDDFRNAHIPALSTLRENKSISVRALFFNTSVIFVVYLLYYLGHLTFFFLVTMTVMNAALLLVSLAAMQERPKEFYLNDFRFSLAYMFVFLFSLIISGVLSPVASTL